MKPAIAGAAILLLVLAWFFRWEVVPVQGIAAFYKVNRWTGTTYLCRVSACQEVTERAPHPE